MQIVIDIPEEEYRWIKKSDETVFANVASKECMLHAIRNGTPLPEHHGRLGDLDALEKEIINGIKAGNYEEGYEEYAHINDMDDCVECVRYTPTIIEAEEVNADES